MIISNDKFLFNKFMKTTTIDTLFFFGIYMYAFFLSPYLSTLGWSEGLKGVFFALFSIIGIVAAPVVGTISDKIGRFHLIMIGLGIEMFALVGLVLWTHPVALFIVRILSSIAYYCVVLSAISRVNDIVKNAHRGKANGLFHSIISVAIIIAPLVGGAIADSLGYEAVFFVALLSMIVILSGIVVFDAFFYSDDHPHRKKDKLKKRDFNPIADVKAVLKYKELRAISVVGICVNFAMPFSFLVLPFIIIQKMGLSNTHLSIAVFLIGFAYLFQVGFGSFADKVGKGQAVMIGTFLSAFGLLMLFFAQSYLVLLLFILVKSFGNSLFNVSAWAYMSDYGEKYKIEGKVVGSYQSVVRIFSTISSILTGVVLVALHNGVFIVYGLITLIPFVLVRKIMLEHKKVAVK